MARPVMGCPMPWSLQEGTEEPETNPSVPQQEKQPDAAEGKVIADYDQDISYEGPELKNKPVAQEEKRKILTQIIQTWRYLEMGLSARGRCLAMF